MKTLHKKIFTMLLFSIFTAVSGVGIVVPLLPVYVDSEFSLSSSAIAILMMLGVLISGSMKVPMGMLTDRLNQNPKIDNLHSCINLKKIL